MTNILSCVANEEFPPLPEDLTSQHSVFTRNDVLGYVPRITYSLDARVLVGYIFSDGYKLTARLRLCPALLVGVSAALHRLSEKFKMIKLFLLERKKTEEKKRHEI